MDQDRTRVAVVGDSFVVNDFGLGKPRHAVPKDKSMRHLFSTDDDVLKAGPPPVVQGFGEPGLRVRGDRRWDGVTLQLAGFKPDLVIFFCGGNDFCDIGGASLGVSGEDLFRSCQDKMKELQLSLPGRPQMRWALLHPRLPRYWSSDKVERWTAEAKAFNSAALEYHRDGKNRTHSGQPRSSCLANRCATPWEVPLTFWPLTGYTQTLPRPVTDGSCTSPPSQCSLPSSTPCCTRKPRLPSAVDVRMPRTPSAVAKSFSDLHF